MDGPTGGEVAEADGLRRLLDERPDLRGTLERLLDVHERTGAWQPDAEGVDRESVATLVEEGYVEEAASGYRLRDPAAVRTALDEYRSASRARLRRALVAGVVLLAVVRFFPLFDVFRGDWVVLLSNDPYMYRYLVDQALAGGGLPSLPAFATRGEPLLVALLSVASAPFGAGTWGSGVVVAFYPVVVAAATGLCVYAIAARLSDDVRVGLAALGLLAVTPAHAYRTSVGVADHHALDYVWLSLTVLAVVDLLTRDRERRETWLVAGLLGVALAAQTLSWEAAPLLFFPLVPALALVALVERRRDGGDRLAPIAGGLGVAAALAHGVHFLAGWQYAETVYALDLLFLGGVGLYGLVAVVDRGGLPWQALLGLEAAFGVVAAVAWRYVPGLSTRLAQGLAFFRPGRSIGELSSLGSTYGVFGPLLILGFAPFLAVPTLLWAVRRGWRRAEAGWLVVSVYAVYFGALAVFQRRFAGEAAPFLAVLGGVGFVALVAWFDLVRLPVPLRADADAAGVATDDVRVPDRTRLLLLGGFGAVAVGTGGLYTALIDRLLVIDEASYRAARWMHDHAEERGWTYPENYVLSKWGRNRMYNYFVNGEARGYGYAQRNYEDFLFSSGGQRWYRQFEGRVGFVVTRDLPHLGTIHPARLQARLHERYGSAGEQYGGVGHFRAVYATDDGSRKVFTLVPGATLEGSTDADELVLSTRVSIPGAAFDYVRRVTPTEGTFAVTVAHPGTYDVGGRSVVVEERDVLDGETIRVDAGRG
ncbi:MAG: STT3 domain-containing protein [Halobacterium sp.]